MGIQINGSTDTISAIDGSLSLEGGELRTVSGLNASGVATATAFIGDLTGSVYAGIVTATSSVVVAAGTTAAPSISPSGDSNTGIFFPSADTIAFGEGGVERARIDSSGRLLVGTNSDFTNGTGTKLQTIDSAGGQLAIGRTGSLSAGFLVGRIRWYGNAGGTPEETAQISVQADGTHALGDKPGRITFSTTADGASSPTERLRITSAGLVGIGTDSPGTALHLGNSSTLRINNPDGTRNLELFNNGSNAEIKASVDPLRLNAEHSSGYIRFDTNNTERARVDSSGRLLVGTSTAYGNYLIQIQGNAAGSTNSGSLSLRRGLAPASLVTGDTLGFIDYGPNDGGIGARIEAQCDGASGTNDYPSRLVFSTTANGSSSPSEAIRIINTGFLKAKGDNGSYESSTAAQHEFLSNRQNNDLLVTKNFNGSYTATNYMALAARSASSAYAFMYCVSGHAGGDNEFRLMGDGNAYADGSWNGGGADYAEMFEWLDGNADIEDRRGISVVLDGDKIREAVTGEDPIGVISGNPSVVGDAAWNKWNQKHLTDDYGSYIYEDHNVIEWTDEEGITYSYEDWNIPDGVVVPSNAVIKSHDDKGERFKHRSVNPAYDPDQEYIPREQRPEWDCVGLMGKLRIRKGQVTGSRWIKMRDISDSVEEWLVR